MALPNLTREQAVERAALVTVDNYRIVLDLTDGEGRPVIYNREVPVHGMLAASNGQLATPLLAAIERLRDGRPQPA